jgi:outer membrane lipoprotein-sorting protein
MFGKATLAVLLLPALVSPVLAQDKEAEKLFRAMEKRITRAPAFKVAILIEAGRDTGRPASFKGFLLLTRDNKARLNVSGADFGEVRVWQMVSDGKQMKLRPYDIGVSEVAKEEATLPTPKDLHDHLAWSVSRLGLYPHLPRMPVMLASDGALQMLSVRGFKAGPAQKVGGRDAQAVHFKLGVRELKDQATVTVWIDTKTQLPLKRVINLGPAWGGAITETYPMFTLDPRPDAGAFELNFPINEAEKLFRAMHEKIQGATAVRATVRIEAKAGGKGAMGRASMLFTKDNQARFKVEIDTPDMKEAAEMISDGRRVKFAKAPDTLAKAEADPVPARFSGRLTRMLSSLGVLLAYEDVNGAAPTFEGFHLVSFEAGTREKVGGRDAQVISYTVVGLPGSDWNVSLWVDAETGLPLKRVLVPIEGRLGQITETYEITLNPKITAGAFSLPK